LGILRNKITKVVDDHDFIHRTILGETKFLNIGETGKPLSVINLSLSIGRSQGISKISREDIHDETNDCIENLENTLALWSDELNYGKIDPLSTLTSLQRRMVTTIHKHGPKTILELSKEMTISVDECARNVNSLLKQGVLYQFDSNKYDVVTR